LTIGSLLDNHKSVAFGLCSLNRSFDGIDDVSHVVIGDVWAGGQAHTDFEESFRNSIHIRDARVGCHARDAFILAFFNFYIALQVAWLFVHRLPDRACLNLSLVESHDPQTLKMTKA